MKIETKAGCDFPRLSILEPKRGQNGKIQGGNSPMRR